MRGILPLVRIALVLLVALGFAAGAAAAPPAVRATARQTVGVAPFAVTLSAAGDAATYSWTLGDGASAAGANVRHVYGAGRFVATVTATSAEGETARAQVKLRVRKRTVSLSTPHAAEYGAPTTVRGVLQPAVMGARVQIYRGRTYVGSARVSANGRFHSTLLLRSPGPYEVRYGSIRSAPRLIRVRPRLETSLAANAPVGGALTLSARLVPASAGSLRVDVRRGGKLIARSAGKATLRAKLPTGAAGPLRVSVAAVPNRGYAAATRRLATEIVFSSLGLGSRGPSVLALERRLSELHYALRGIDALYAIDTLEAVITFQKVQGLARTGLVDASLWRRLAGATVPRPRYPNGDGIEVDKTRQVLFEVQRGEVERVVGVSTGATGNTPLGTWHVYRKVTGFDWVLWYPMYFLRGFAIHGYPSVPAYPASHGCVRVPMWIAPLLFAGHDNGATVTIYL